MPFTAAQLTSFFENGPQMSLTAIQRNRLSAEGLATIDDFMDFKEDQLDDAAKNMRTAIPGVPAVLDANGTEITAALPPTLPCLISAKCSLRLKVASIAFHYYMSIDRNPTPTNMNYTSVLRPFYVEWEALLKLSDESKPDVPVLTKHITPLKWVESFKDCLLRTFGVRTCPLLYVIRDNTAVVPDENDPLIPGSSFGSSGSVLDELISRLSHTDPLFKSDNSTVYSLLEEATRGTIYAPSIKPYARRKDGRSAWLSMISSHAGADKWEKLQQERLSFLINTQWNGRQYSLEKFTGLHRSSFVQLEEAAEHVDFQLPTEHTRVGYLMKNIKNADPDLRAVIASIRLDTNNMRNNFEAAVASLLPVCPYAKHRADNQRSRAQVSDITLKSKSQSKTGVDFRWHTKSEYDKLNQAQRKELYTWQKSIEGSSQMSKAKSQRDANPHKRPPSDNRPGDTKKQLYAKIKALEAAQSQPVDVSTEEMAAAIASATVPAQPAPRVLKPATPIAPSPRPGMTAAIAIQNLLKRKRE
jgi:hypothetical protein